MKYIKVLLSLALLLTVLTGSALAVQTHTMEDIKTFDVSAPDGFVISTMNLDNIEPGYNTTTHLNSYGKEYTLHINNTKSTGWWTFDITLIDPDGVKSTTQLETFQPFATDSDLKIQYFYPENDHLLDVDVYVGLLPLTAQFTQPVSVNSTLGGALPNEYTYTRIAYSRVSGSTTNPADLKVYFSSQEEFEAQQQESIKEYLSGGTELFTAWAWSSVLTFVEKIPGIGPYFAQTLEITALVVGTTYFYFNLLFIEYPETTILTIEFFILSKAVINNKKRHTIMDFIENIVNSHVVIITFFITVMFGVIEIFTALIKTVAAIVQAIKPI